ncbi:MAG: LptF/LptG family permease [Planctomycetota bacterium]
MKKTMVNWCAILVGLLIMMALGDFAGTIKSLSHLSEKLASKSEIIGILAGYYLCQTPQWLLLLIPASALLSASLLVNQIQRHHEWMAMHSAGLSLHKMLAPCIALLSLASALLLWVDQEHILPSIRNASFSLRDHSRSAKDDYTLLQGVTASGTIFQGTWHHSENILKDILLVFPHETWVAEEGSWKGHGWDFRRVKRYKPVASARPHEILTHGNWFWETDLGPSELSQLFRNTDFLSREQLLSQSARFPGERALSMTATDRLFRPLTPWILLMVGLPLTLSRYHPFLAAVRVAGVALTFTLVQVLFFRLGTDGVMTPLMASTIPLALGLGLSLVFWTRVRT